MSKFDRPDPSLDHEYCDGLSPLEEYLDAVQEAELTCLWCGDETDGTLDYCSTLCAVHAETDDCER